MRIINFLSIVVVAIKCHDRFMHACLNSFHHVMSLDNRIFNGNIIAYQHRNKSQKSYLID